MLLPLKVDVPMWRTPWANYGLIAVIVLLSIAAFSNSDFAFKLAGAEFSENNGDLDVGLVHSTGGKMWAGITSMFLHGGWMHLIGNMWFLWVFGNAINYKFGHLQYLGLFLLAGWLGSMLFYACEPGTIGIGASGAINGIVGAFLVFFPKNDITVAWLWGIWGKSFSVSSFWIILYWLAWDVGSLALGVQSRVGYWAHIGGFVAGFAVAMLCASTKLIKPTQDEETLIQVFSPPQKPKRRYY